MRRRVGSDRGGVAQRGVHGIGPVRSEVLVLGLPDDEDQVVLIGPDKPVPIGGRMY